MEISMIDAIVVNVRVSLCAVLNEARSAKVSHADEPQERSEPPHCGTHPQNEEVSHTNLIENTLSRGLVWDTLAKMIKVRSSLRLPCKSEPHPDRQAPCPGCRTVLRSGRRAGVG